MDGFFQDLYLQGAAHQPPERGGGPQPLVVSGPGIQGDDQLGRADEVGIAFQIGREVRGTAFLGEFDEDDDARKLAPFQGLHRGHRGEQGITVVGSAPAVEFAVFEDRGPGAEAFAPTFHFRLFVQVAVDQNGLLDCTGNVDEKQRGPAGQAQVMESPAGNGMGVQPVHRQPPCRLHVAVGGPFGIELRGLVGNSDVFGERGEDFVLPKGIDGLAE